MADFHTDSGIDRREGELVGQHRCRHGHVDKLTVDGDCWAGQLVQAGWSIIAVDGISESKVDFRVSLCKRAGV